MTVEGKKKMALFGGEELDGRSCRWDGRGWEEGWIGRRGYHEAGSRGLASGD